MIDNNNLPHIPNNQQAGQQEKGDSKYQNLNSGYLTDTVHSVEMWIYSSEIGQKP